jgi:biopolymer transport protein ExbD
MPLHRKKRSNPDPVVNLTPLIDVVFVVLIVFILVAPMISVDKLTLAPKKRASSAVIDENKELTLRLHKDGTLSVAKKIVPRSQWLTTLKAHQTPDKRALLLCDKTVTFGTYQALKDTLEEAGFEKLDIAVSPAKKGR